MFGSIFIEQLKVSWRQALYWGGGLFCLNLMIMGVIQDVDVIEQYRVLLDRMPPLLLSAFGLSDVSVLTTPEGFIAFAAFTYGLLAMCVFGVLAGTAITANDEDDGIMDVLLSLPIPRRQVIVERFTAYAVITLAIALIAYLGIVAGTFITPLTLDLGILFQGAMNFVAPVILIIALTAFLASIITRKIFVLGIAGSVVIYSYLLYSFAGAVDLEWMRVVERFSFFYYSDAEQVALEGLALGNVALLLGIAVALIAVSLFTFERRDIIN